MVHVICTPVLCYTLHCAMTMFSFTIGITLSSRAYARVGGKYMGFHLDLNWIMFEIDSWL